VYYVLMFLKKKNPPYSFRLGLRLGELKLSSIDVGASSVLRV